MAKGIFVTGSGTGVGKTYVSKLLLRGFAGLGHGVTYMKPVETGCGIDVAGGIDASRETDIPFGDDTRGALECATCVVSDLSLHSPYRFVPACSPHLAARLAGSRIDVSRIVSAYNNLCRGTGADIAVVEGAGGVLAPINDGQYMIDVMRALDIPAILVTEPGLGSLNHTSLSLRELARGGGDVIGLAVNNARGINRDYVYEDNIAEIRRYVAGLPFVDIDYHKGVERKSHADEGRNRPGGDTQNDSREKREITEFCNAVASRL